MTELYEFGAYDLAQLIQEKRCSAVEALESHLARIEAYNPLINAIVTFDTGRAIERAKAADEALAQGRSWGPLHGVPMTVKDVYRTEGTLTTLGFPVKSSNFVPGEDATVIKKLRRAGAIIFGKTNLPLGSYDWQTRNPKFGRANNPWNLNYTPGGSSGGSAAALAARFTPLEMGTDVAGSLRVPAHFCGVTSLRPTEGWLSDVGVHAPPGFPRSVLNIITGGPMARSVKDLKLAMSVVAGPDPRRWNSPPIPWFEQTCPVHLKGLKVAFRETLGGIPICNQTKSLFRRFLAQLENVGCIVEEAQPEFDFQDAMKTWGHINGHEIASVLPLVAKIPPTRWLLRGLFPLLFGNSPATQGLAQAFRLSNRQYYEALDERSRLIHLMETFLQEWDVFLCPSAATPAFTHRKTGKPIVVEAQNLTYSMACGIYNCPSALTGNPITVLPLGLSQDGLPIGIQVNGGRWQDARLLDITEQMEALIEPLAYPSQFELPQQLSYYRNGT